MRHLHILIIALIVGQEAFAQNKNDIDVFKNDILTLFEDYFENVEISGEGKINLYATSIYNLLPVVKKNTIIEIVLSKSTEDLAIVHYQYKNELWKKEMKGNRVSLIDAWDMNSIKQTSDSNIPKKTNSHPLFFYFGGGGTYSDTMDGDGITSLNFSTRLGFFLLINRWDLALSYSYTLHNVDNEYYSDNVALMTKIYFPIRKIRINPYIGTGISYSTMPGENFDRKEYMDTPVYVGISWVVGHGSIDLGYQYGKDSMFTIGYTFLLWSK